MALADPQSVTVNGTAVSLPRTGLSLDGGNFRSTDGQYELVVQHTRGKRVRHLIRLQSSEIVSDPLVPAQNVPVAFHAHIVLDIPRQGVTNTQLQKLSEALIAWASPSNLGKVIAGES